jgi:Holliday junction resolvase RusA-like endonuclease
MSKRKRLFQESVPKPNDSKTYGALLRVRNGGQVILEFEIEGLPKMTNTLRKHWAVIQKERAKWKRLVAQACLNEKDCAARIRKPLTQAQVTITRFSSTAPDYDGLVSAGKAILDGLVEAGVIVDDNVSVIGQPKYLWEKAKPKMGKVRVRVESAA